MKDLKPLIDSYLKKYIMTTYAPSRLREAMEYSLFPGGKRIRPILCLICNRIGAQTFKEYNSKVEDALPFACGIEMIHTYSLIHDDLPGMDNDDIRRGKPSTHKKFDVATAILAGDALLSDAFDVMAKSKPITNGAEYYMYYSIIFTAKCIGSCGMVGGQMMDIEYSGVDLSTRSKKELQEELEQMQCLKTAKLFEAACFGGAAISSVLGGESDYCGKFGRHFGMAFQIIDDINDVTLDTETLGKPAGSDLRQGKLTWPALIGIEESKIRAQKEIELAIAAISKFDGEYPDALREYANKLMEKVK